jgi:hypothetical protein
MGCPLCDSCSAVLQERPADDQMMVKCDQFGEVIFTRTQYAVLGSLDSSHKKLLQDYCSKSYKRGEVITDVTMKSL